MGENIQCEKEIPHITLMVGDGWRPVYSNDVLKSLFNVKYGLKKEMIRKQQDQVEKVNVMINNTSEDCYIVIKEKGEFMNGVFKKFYD